MNFKLYKIDDHANTPYYSTEPNSYYDCVEVEKKEVASYSVTTNVVFNTVMEKFCTYHEDGIGFDDWSCWEINSDYVCVIECDELDRHVVEYFYSENDCNAGLVYDLPYWLHFVKV